MKIIYQFAGGIVSEDEAEGIYAIIIEDRWPENNFFYDYVKLPFFIEKIYVRDPHLLNSSFQKYYEWRIRK